MSNIISLEDGGVGESQLYLFSGEKRVKGDWFARSGLSEGLTYVMADPSGRVKSEVELRAVVKEGEALRVGFREVRSDVSGVTQSTEGKEKGISFSRIEDGVIDPLRPNDLYFAVTESPVKDGVRDGGGVYRLRFDDIDNPLEGGSLELVLTGEEDIMLFNPDNLEIAGDELIIAEDSGENEHRVRVVSFNLVNGVFKVLVSTSSRYFTKLWGGYITNNEEFTGVLEVSKEFTSGRMVEGYGIEEGFRYRYFLVSLQIHRELSDYKEGVGRGIEGAEMYLLRVRY